MSLVEREIFNDKGERAKVEYYESATVNPDGSISYDNIILETNWIWTRDPLDYPVHALEEASYYLEDGSLGTHKKPIPHYFDGLHKIEEGVNARTRKINNMMLPVSEMLIYHYVVSKIIETGDQNYQASPEEMKIEIQKGRDFLTAHHQGFSGFKQHADPSIVQTIKDDTVTPWLDYAVPNAVPAITIRDYIVGKMEA